MLCIRPCRTIPSLLKYMIILTLIVSTRKKPLTYHQHHLQRKDNKKYLMSFLSSLHLLNHVSLEQLPISVFIQITLLFQTLRMQVFDLPNKIQNFLSKTKAVIIVEIINSRLHFYNAC